VFDQFLSIHDPDAAPPPQESEGKDLKRQAAGRKGGLQSGVVRALILSVQERKEIAQKGADARWSKKTDSD